MVLFLKKNGMSLKFNIRNSNFNSISRYKLFKNFNKRICVATDVFGRGIDIERVNVVFNYDTPGDADTYLHRVGRAGRFGTRGLSKDFIII